MPFIVPIYPVPSMSTLRCNISQWSKITNLQKIRDCIVHTSGFVDKSRDKKYLLALVNKYRPELQIDDFDSRLIISTEYCKTAIQSIIGFLDEIFDKVGISVLKSHE